MKLKRFEMETVIQFNEESHIAEIYTTSERVAKKLMKALEVEESTTSGGKTTSWSFTVPDHAVIIKTNSKFMRLGKGKNYKKLKPQDNQE